MIAASQGGVLILVWLSPALGGWRGRRSPPVLRMLPAGADHAVDTPRSRCVSAPTW